MTIEFEGSPKKKPTKLGTVTTVDMQTGEVVEERRNAFTMLPPKGDVCQECGTDHGPDDPHNQQSLMYQYNFYGKNGRWPTWTDSMKHCPPAVRDRWRAALVAHMREKGLTVPDDLKDG